MTKDLLFAFIETQRFAVVSTVNADSAPEAALVGIAVTPELEIVFDTVRTSRKYANLSTNQRVALVVGCSGDRTLQYEGIASEPTGLELARCKAAYFAKFSDGPSREASPATCYFVVRPKWIRFSDYGETPILIEEFNF